MEPFSITCTTCKSRLKVKSEAAIGHLLKCPKCGGLVMVKLPEDPKPGDSASLRAETAPAIQKPIRPADAQDTLGENQDFDEIDALLATGAPKAMPPAAKSAAPTKTAVPAKTSGPAKTAVKDKPSRFAEGEAAAPANGAASGISGVAVGGANGKSALAPKDSAQQEQAPPVPGSEVVPLPSGDWSGQRPWKYWLFLAVSVLLGTGLAFGVVAFSLSFFRDNASVAVNPDQNPGGETKPGETTPKPGTAAEVPGETKTKQPAESPKATTENPGTTKTPAKPAVPEKGKTETAKTAPAPAPDEDPLGLNKKPSAETKPTVPLANDPFSKFDPLVNNPKDPTAPAPAPTMTTPSPKPAEGPVEGPVKAALPRPPARAINVTARMNDALPGLSAKADEVPLADFLQLMQDFSTIPITLEPDNLAIFSQSANTPMPAFDLENLKFGQVLNSALLPMGLEAALEDDQIIVRKPELVLDKMTRERKLMAVKVDVKDLIQDEKQAGELAERIMALVEPGSWGDEEDETACALTPGKEAFAVRHRLSAQVQILTLIEKLRAARGLPQSKRAAETDAFKLITRTEKAAARLAAPVSLTLNRPTPLVKICQKLSAAGKMRILIDWRSISSAGWNPDAELTLVVDKKPFAEALTALVEPMDLAYRVVDGRTIQIVSPQYLAEHLELELHPVKELVPGPEQIEPLLARVRASLAEGGADVPGHLWIDSESKCLVTMLPQPKQQLLSRLLAEWRTKETN